MAWDNAHNAASVAPQGREPTARRDKHKPSGRMFASYDPVAFVDKTVNSVSKNAGALR